MQQKQKQKQQLCAVRCVRYHLLNFIEFFIELRFVVFRWNTSESTWVVDCCSFFFYFAFILFHFLLVFISFSFSPFLYESNLSEIFNKWKSIYWQTISIEFSFNWITNIKRIYGWKMRLTNQNEIASGMERLPCINEIKIK